MSELIRVTDADDLDRFSPVKEGLKNLELTIEEGNLDSYSTKMVVREAPVDATHYMVGDWVNVPYPGYSPVDNITVEVNIPNYAVQYLRERD